MPDPITYFVEFNLDIYLVNEAFTLRNTELNVQRSYSIKLLAFLLTNKGEKNSNDESVEIGTLMLMLLGTLKL